MWQIVFYFQLRFCRSWGGCGGGGGGGADAGLLLSELLQLSTLPGRSGLDILVVVLKKIRACVEQCLGCLQTIV